MPEGDRVGIVRRRNHRVPPRTKSLTLSTDPLFVANVRAIVGLCLNPPDKALDLCVDKKSQIRALERARPVLRWA